MYNAVQLSLKYLHYLVSASNGKGHGIHSPFVFDFVEQVLNKGDRPAAFGKVEKYRQSLMESVDLLEVEDFGAGSAYGGKKERRVRDIARQSAKSPKYGRLLYRIAEHYTCRHIIELGTSLGVSTAYLASAGSVEKLVTLEGSPSVASKAREGMDALGLKKVQVVTGNFDHMLADVLRDHPHPDLVFIDGNHQELPTWRYFNQCKEASGEECMMIFDDIHWSEGMEKVWEKIKADASVRCTIDLFFVGIVLFRRSFLEKQHFVIRY